MTLIGPGPADDAGCARAESVVYVVGSGRSGSTLLDRMLGQATDVIAVGELVQLWTPGELDKLVCGCGEPVRTCALWSAVADRAFGGWESEDFQLAVELRSIITRHRYLPLQLLPGDVFGFGRRAQVLGRIAERTYDAISEVSGCAVVVDSSKEVAFAYVAAQAMPSRLRLVHLVRNGRGVAYSWTKSVPKPELGNPNARLPRYKPIRMAVRWVIYNLLVDPLRMRGIQTLAMRYESLVEDPKEALGRVLTMTALPPDGSRLDFVDGSTVHLTPSHTVAGNPMRFRQGAVTLRIDEAWRTGMSRRDKILATVIMSPLLLRFGYFRRRHPVVPAAQDVR